MKAVWAWTALLVLIGVLIVLWFSGHEAPSEPPSAPVANPVEPAHTPPNKDYRTGAYIIEGKPVYLTDGLSEEQVTFGKGGPDAGAALAVTTKYFGNEASGDLDGDGRPDTAFILTQDSGGTGNFYYVVAALDTETGYRGTNGIAIGDRISPQAIDIANGEITVSYADRRPDEPMAMPPSVLFSKKFKVAESVLVPAD